MAIEVERMIATLEARFTKYEKAVEKLKAQTASSFGAVEAAGTNLEKSSVSSAARAGKAWEGSGNQARKLAKDLSTVRMQTGNLAAQFNDIGVQLAGGQSPFLIALQQGTQISQVIGSAGAAGAVSALGGAFMSLLNPISLATIAAIAVGGAVVQYLADLGDVETVDEALKAHSDLIKSLPQAYQDAAEAATRYIVESRKVSDDKLKSDIDALTSQLVDQAKLFSGAADEVRLVLKDGVATEALALKSEFEPFRAAIEAFRATAAAGKPDFIGLRDAIIDIKAAASGNEDVQSAGKALQAMAEAGINVDTSLRQAQGALDGVGGAAAAQVKGVNALTEALQALADVAAIQPTDAERADAAYKKALSEAKTPADRASADASYLAALDRIAGANAPIPPRKPNTLNEGWNGVTKKAGGGSRATAADQFDRSLQQVRDRTEALRQETETIGLSEAASQRKQIALALEQRALADLREEARRKGETDLQSIQLSDQQIAKINAVSDAYAAQYEAYRSLAEQQQKIDAAAGDAWSSVKTGIMDVISGASSLQDALAGVLQRLAEIAASNALDALLSPSSGGAGGGVAGGIMAFIGKLLGGGFEGGGYTGAGGRSQPAGVVHRGEYVMSKAAVDRIGVGRLDALHSSLKGYAMGGYVGTPSIAAPSRGGAVAMNLTMNVDARGSTNAEELQRQIRESATQAVKTAVEVSRRSLPKWQSDYATYRG